MNLQFFILFLIPLAIAEENNYRNRNDDHVNSIGFEGSSFGGCRKRHPDNKSLQGGAEACVSHKPLKVKGLEKVGKRLCAEGYEYCTLTHKSLHQVSWKTESMPNSCFAFHYKKDKFAGYGHNCHRNLYYDGMLCCPKSIPSPPKNKHHRHRVNHRVSDESFRNPYTHNYNYVKK